MSAGEKFRVISGAARAATETADRAMAAAEAALVYNRILAAHLGLEVVSTPVAGDESKIRIRYRRRLPMWLAWVRKIGVCR